MNELLGLEIIWVHVSRLPVPHLDKTDGNILYLTLFLLMGGDATQFLLFFLHTTVLCMSAGGVSSHFTHCQSFLLFIMQMMV